MNKEKLEKLRRNANQVRTGGKHTVRRKKKVVRKNASVDDKKLQATLKKLGCNALPGIEDVTLFKNDGNVIQFKNPKVQFSMQMNVFAVTGTHEERPLLPKDIAEKLGSLRNLKDDEIPDLEGKTLKRSLKLLKLKKQIPLLKLIRPRLTPLLKLIRPRLTPLLKLIRPRLTPLL